MYALICCTGDVATADELLRVGPTEMRRRQHPLYYEFEDDCEVMRGVSVRPNKNLRRRYIQPEQ
jgi:hypothetical protein